MGKGSLGAAGFTTPSSLTLLLFLIGIVCLGASLAFGPGRAWGLVLTLVGLGAFAVLAWLYVDYRLEVRRHRLERESAGKS